MTSKELFLKALNREETPAPPVYCSIVPQLAQPIADYLGVECPAPADSPMSGSRISYQDLMIGLGADCIGVAGCAPDNAPTHQREDGLIVDEWGIGKRNNGLYDEFAYHPLANAKTVEDIENYKFPDINAPGRFRFAEEQIAKYGKDYGIIGDLECSIFETSWYLVGLEKLFIDMAMEEPYVDVLMDKIVDFHTAVGMRLVELGADVIWCGDDLGSQTGPLIGGDMFDRYMAPRIKKMFTAFRSVNPNIKIAWHSCGSIVPLIPKFIDLGLDILNPIQPMATGMNPQFLKDTFGDRLMFFGGICVQDLLPNGTPEHIKSEVKRISSILSKGGGYILAPAHNIQFDTSVENVVAMFEAVKEIKEGR